MHCCTSSASWPAISTGEGRRRPDVGAGHLSVVSSAYDAQRRAARRPDVLAADARAVITELAKDKVL